MQIRELAVAITYSRLFHIIGVLFDFVSIFYFLTWFFVLDEALLPFEFFLGFYFLVEYLFLFLASENRWKYVRHPLALSNLIIIFGYLVAPVWNLGFLRLLRSFRIIHLYQIIPDIRLMTNRTVIFEKLLAMFFHVSVLTFIISEIIFLQQVAINEEINSRFDAFYFTTNAITKVGSGETIELVGLQGQLLTLFIAFLSLSIFVQLLDTVREVQNIRHRKKQGKKKGAKAMRESMEEIYSEQFCTYCDIKNRERMLKTNTAKQ